MTTSDSAARAMIPEPTRTGLAADTLQRAVLDNLTCLLASLPAIATPHDWYMALAYSVRDRMLARWVSTVETYAARDVKIVCYLSAEFLTGPQLGNNLVNLGIEPPVRAAMHALGQDLDALLALEEEPGLGNGGLGRLAACYMDSLARSRCRRSASASATSSASSTGDPRRLAGGSDRQVAAEGQSLGAGAPGDQLLRQFQRPHRGLYRRAGPLSGTLDSGGRDQGRSA
jgi:hypothetical protein